MATACAGSKGSENCTIRILLQVLTMRIKDSHRVLNWRSAEPHSRPYSLQ
jgi:hypothetical protein